MQTVDYMSLLKMILCEVNLNNKYFTSLHTMILCTKWLYLSIQEPGKNYLHNNDR